MPTGVKGKVYRTMVRPVLIYGSVMDIEKAGRGTLGEN